MTFYDALQIKKILETNPYHEDLSLRLKLIEFCYSTHVNDVNEFKVGEANFKSANEVIFQNFVDVFKISKEDPDLLIISLNRLCDRMFPFNSDGQRLTDPEIIDRVSNEGFINFLADSTNSTLKKAKWAYRLNKVLVWTLGFGTLAVFLYFLPRLMTNPVWGELVKAMPFQKVIFKEIVAFVIFSFVVASVFIGYLLLFISLRKRIKWITIKFFRKS